MSEFVFGVPISQIDRRLLSSDKLDLNIGLQVSGLTSLLASTSNRFSNVVTETALISPVFSFSPLSPPPTLPFSNMETDDYAGDASTTGVVDRDGGTISGQIDFSGDSDWFAVELAADEILRVVNPDFNSNIDIVLKDADGNLIDSDFGPPTSLGGFNFGRGNVLMVNQAGTYFLDISSSASTANYSLTTEVVTDDGLASLKWRVLPVT